MEIPGTVILRMGKNNADRVAVIAQKNGSFPRVLLTFFFHTNTKERSESCLTEKTLSDEGLIEQLLLSCQVQGTSAQYHSIPVHVLCRR